ncbi:MAG: hypothetical protein IKF52_02585 [Clostridia bacterium]|nr:hypothetical protein [Clostridia bacterium]
MRQVITDTCTCPNCGYTHTCQDIYTDYKLVPDDYVLPSEEQKCHDDGSFEISLYDFKEFRKNADIGIKHEEKDFGGEPFLTRFLYDNSITFCCPKCGIIFDRAICSKLTVKSN